LTGPQPRPESLRLYGSSSDHPGLAWSWVEEQLAAAGTYWVVARGPGHPHPRPVWGIWTPGRRLELSIGSPVVSRALDADPRVTVHLDSGTDVVLVEGLVEPGVATDPESIASYNHKYDWDYRVDEYGHLVAVRPVRVQAWRCAGWAGRDSFQATGSWAFEPPPG
jgi:hypothetical protein